MCDIAVTVDVHLGEHAFRVANGFNASQNAISIAVDFLGMPFQKTAHGTS